VNERANRQEPRKPKRLLDFSVTLLRMAEGHLESKRLLLLYAKRLVL